MRIRPKTMRRIMLLLTVVIVAGGVIAWLSVLSIRRGRTRIISLRKQAMASYQAGDYGKAVDLLGQYLDKGRAQHSDPEALFAYGKSRVSVAMPQNQQIFEGIQIFQLYLQEKPADPEARKLLLKLYVQAGYNQEAIKLTDQMLAANPADVAALEGKRGALSNQHNYDSALAVSRRLTELNPRSLRDQLATVLLMQAARKSNEQIIEYGQKVQQQHPDDPRFAVVAAYAFKIAGQDQEARARLEAAATQTPDDPEFVVSLAQMLDQNAMYAEADALVRRTAQKSTDLTLRRALAQRLWQDGDLGPLLEQTSDVSPGNSKSDSGLLGYRALALYETGKAAEAAPILTALTARAGDSTAAAWAIALRGRFSASPPAPAQRLRLLQDAALRDPSNSIIQLMVGTTYAEMGETELALLAWKQTAAQAPGWAHPWVLSARAMMAGGRYQEAVLAAEEAMRRAPQSKEPAITFVQAAYGNLQHGGSKADYKGLLHDLEQIQKLLPNEPQSLPLYVSALSHDGRKAEAISALKSAAHADPRPGPEVLLQLAQVSDAEGLGMGDTLRSQAQQSSGMTPQVAAAEARALAQSGKPADGLALLQTAAKGHETEVPWRLVIAVYRDSIGDPLAVKDWATLGDQNPTNLQVQTAILQSPARTQDRALWARSIDRVHALTGDQGLLWRIDRARWLLSGELTEKDKGEAVNLLTDATRTAPALAEPHRLLAVALVRANRNNVTRAIAEMTAAAEASPDDPAITAELARFLIDNDRSTDALAYIERLLKSPTLAAPVRHWAAQQLTLLGKNDRAIAVLEDERKSATPDLDRDMLLAGLYRRAGKASQAADLYRQLLEQPAPDAAYFAQAADFFAARQDLSTAQKMLDRVAQMPLKPGDAELIRAGFAERWKQDDDALEQYRAATTAAPASENAWTALAGFFLRQQKFSQSAGAATEGLKNSPASESLKAIQRHATTLSGLSNAAELRPLVDLLSRDPLNVEAGEMLNVLADARKRGANDQAVASRAQEVAEKFPHSMPVQVLAAQLQAQAGHYDRAAQLAQRAAAIAPAAVEPQALLAAVYFDSSDWDRSGDAIARWRALSSESPLAADLMAARIDLQRPHPDPQAAIQLLAPYLSASLSQPQKDTILSLYTHALAASGRSDEAARLLQPLLPGSRYWRLLWLELAGAGQKDLTSATAWIEQVRPLIQLDAPQERAALARAWYGIGVQFDSSAALANARDLLQPIVAAPDASGPVWMLWAMTTQSLGDYTAAEQGYRQVLKLAPASADAQNDLAYVLWLRGRGQDLPEARRLAEAAVAASPAVASFYDTLARIQAQSGQTELAIKSFRTALQKDPGSLEAMIGLGDLLSKDTSRRGEAKVLIMEVDQRLKSSPPLSSPLRKQFDGVRSALAGTF